MPDRKRGGQKNCVLCKSVPMAMSNIVYENNTIDFVFDLVFDFVFDLVSWQARKWESANLLE